MRYFWAFASSRTDRPEKRLLTKCALDLDFRPCHSFQSHQRIIATSLVAMSAMMRVALHRDPTFSAAESFVGTFFFFPGSFCRGHLPSWEKDPFFEACFWDELFACLPSVLAQHFIVCSLCLFGWSIVCLVCLACLAGWLLSYLAAGWLLGCWLLGHLVACLLACLLAYLLSRSVGQRMGATSA